MRGLVEVVECKIVDTALTLLIMCVQNCAIHAAEFAYFAQKLPQDDEEGHKVARVAGEDALRLTATTNVLCGGAHRWRNDFARRIHEQLGEPFEDFLDDLRVGFLEI
jgi:hypothetical protein